MRREGRQHGMVRTYPIPSSQRPKPASLSGLSPTAMPSQLTKVSRKPTNHSKFTGKCGRPMCSQCHITPACKSKNKVKGAHKLHSYYNVHVVSGYRSIGCRQVVVDVEPDLKLAGFSAMGAVDYLDYLYDDDDDDDDDENYGVDDENADEDWCLVF